MKVRDVLQKDPVHSELLNNGVAEVRSIHSESELKTLRYELETFVCEGQYAQGLDRILTTFAKNLDNPVQPAVWISGFFGSGKSHLAKMLRALWIDFKFPDGASARGIAHLSEEVRDALRELSTAGKRYGGLHAAGGTLSAGAGDSVRLAFLGILFGSRGLPEKYPFARFVLWLRQQGIEQEVRASLAAKGRDFDRELGNLYVSPVLAAAVLAALPDFAATPADALKAFAAQFPTVKDVTNEDVYKAVHDALSADGELPCTLVVLDEVQQYIGENQQRSIDVQELVEFCCNKFGGKLLVVGTGQMALNSTPLLQRLTARFKVPVSLSDSDVETVIRKIVLAKRPDRSAIVQQALEQHAGEISRHLVSTRIAHTVGDDAYLVADYPLLPVRRKFWEKVLRAVDRAGTVGQLRTQLKVVHDSVRAVAERPLGWVVPADFIYRELQHDLLTTGVLLREVHDDIIEKQRDGTEEGELRARLCALVFLIGKLPREPGSDAGIRANAEALADLMVADLSTASASALRMQIPPLLEQLVQGSYLIEVEGEYRLQTRESAAWNTEYQQRYAQLVNDDQRMAHERADRIRGGAAERVAGVKIPHGKSKIQRRVQLFFGQETPQGTGQAIPVWVRDGWEDDEKAVVADAHKAGTSSPLILVFVPKRGADDLKKAVASLLAANEVLTTRPSPTTPEGTEAREAMLTRQRDAEGRVKAAIESIFGGARVLLAGGEEYNALTLDAAVGDAARAALTRLFPQFDLGDNPDWAKVVQRARGGDGAALEAVGYKGDTDKHPVCSTVLNSLGPGKKGSDLRKVFGGEPYGWPQDTVDGAMLVLHLAGHVRASLNGATLQHKQLDHAKIGPADFRSEQVFISTTQRIALRGLFQEVGISCKAGEEGSKAPEFIAATLALAADAGGEAPAPTPPAAPRLVEIKALAGNEQLLELWKERDSIKADITDWRARAAKIKARLPRWERLQQLLKHARGLAIAEQVVSQITAVAEQRLLLADPDPVPALADQLTQALRGQLTDALQGYRSVYEHEMASLEATDVWQRVPSPNSTAILHDVGIRAPEQVRVGTEDEVIRALNVASLETWYTRRDALPHRFQQALDHAHKLLEPKAVKVNLPPATVHSPDELDAWFGKVRDRVLTHLENGPVIL